MSDQEPGAKPEKMGYEGRAVQAQVSVGDDLWEMHSAAGKISEFTLGRSLEDYRESELLRAVVASMLGVLAGALGRLAEASAATAARIDAPNLLELASALAANAASEKDTWAFVQHALPELAVRIQTELEAWHQA